MVSEDRVLIARYSFRKNSLPRLVALVPHLGEGGGASYLDMTFLPFADDIREWSFASLPQSSPEQRLAVTALVDAMDLDSISTPVEPGAEKQRLELLHPETTNSPSLGRFYAFLAQRAIDPAAKVPPASLAHSRSLERPDRMLSKLEVAKCAEQLQKAFSLERVEKTKKKTKHFWREAIAEKRKDPAFGEVDTKRIKVDAFKKDEKEEEDKDKVKTADVQAPAAGAASSFGMAMAVPAVPAQPPKVQIGSVHPERDFEKWLAHRVGGHDTVGPAIEQMKSMIDSLVEEGDDFHSKALSCLRTLRSGCVREGEVLAFNNFVRSLRAAKTFRKAKFWSKARDEGLGLITDGEAPTSSVTAEESRAFLAGEEATLPPPSAPAAAAAPLSEQALEDMIE
jgi:hypothetical protein